MTASKRFMLSLVAIVMAFAMTVPATAFAAPAAPTADYTSYTVEAVNDGGTDDPQEYGQNVIITYTFASNVTFINPDTLIASLQILIAGNDITSDSYYRPLTVVGDPVGTNTLVLKICNVEDKTTGDKQFTAQYNGILQLSGAVAGLDVGGMSVSDLSIRTVIPVGFTWEQGATLGDGTEYVEGGVGAAALTVTSHAQVRGMYHIGIYTLDGDTGELVPIYAGTDTSPIQCKTYVAHAHDFVTMLPSDLADNAATAINGSANFPSSDFVVTPVKITDDSAALIIEAISDEYANTPLYVYIFDDNLLQPLGVSYTDIVNAQGVLPSAL